MIFHICLMQSVCVVAESILGRIILDAPEHLINSMESEAFHRLRSIYPYLAIQGGNGR